MNNRVTFLGKGQVELTQVEPLPIGPDQIRIRTTVSLISTGTEGICFNRLFEPGTHWDKWVKYPFYTGYCTVATVTEIGAEVSQYQVGDRVFARVSHSTEHVVRANQIFPIPEGVSDEEAMWAALSMIGSMVLATGDIRLADDVLIVGAGPVGQMALRWCIAAGCKTVIADTVPMRLEMARIGGAFATIQSSASDLHEQVKQLFGCQPRIVIDTTGNAAVFEQCLSLPRDFGTLVLLGDTGTPSEQRLTSDVLRRGVRIHACHVSHEGPDWYEVKIHQRFFELLRTGRFSVKELNTHRFVPQACGDAFELTTHRRTETMGVWFDWN